RGIARRREVAVRLALGIGHGRLVRLLLLESVTLAACGTALALVLVQYGGGLLRAVLLPGVEFAQAPVDTGVLLFTAFLGAVTGLLSGLAPALQLSRPDLTVELKGSGIGDTRSGGRQHARLRTGLLLTQATLSAVLLVGAGLFVKSL